MAAGINDKFTRVSDGARPTATTVSTVRNSGSTTLECADLTGWDTTRAIHFVTYRTNSAGEIEEDSQTDWKGIVSGSNLTNLTVTGGSDDGNQVGDIVVALPTAQYAKDLYDGLSAQHNPDGTHGDVTMNDLTVAGEVNLPEKSIPADSLDDDSVVPRTIAANTTLLGYSSSVSSTSTSGTSFAAITGADVTVTIPTGVSAVKLTFSCRSLFGGTVGGDIVLGIFKGTVSGTKLNETASRIETTNVSKAGFITALDTSPTPGSQQYTVGIRRQGGSGSVSAQAADGGIILFTAEAIY